MHRQILNLERCPACGSTEYRVTGPVAPPISAEAGGVTFEQAAYCVRECEPCGLLFRDRILPASELADYYARIAPSKWEIAGFYPTERAVLERLREMPSGSKILDFGCSSGRLLAGLLPEYDRYGIEINENAARSAAAKGLTMLSFGDLAHADAPQFDAIVLVDVFEHLTDPLAILQTLVGVLRRGGALIIVTGNGDASACRRDPAQFWYFRIIEHVTMLTRRSAEFIATQLDLKLIEWIPLTHYDLTFRETLVQRAQDFLYWKFRKNTMLARMLKPLPLFPRLREAKVAPVFSCTQDHVLAIFTKE